MSSIVIAGDSSGSVTLQAPAVSGSTVLNLPATSGTIQASGAGYTTNGVAYATSATGLVTGSTLAYNGTRLLIGGVSAGTVALSIPAGDITSDVSSGSFAVGNYGNTSSELRLSTRGFTTFRTGATDGTNGTERGRFTAAGEFLLTGLTSPIASGILCIASNLNNNNPIVLKNTTTQGASQTFVVFYNSSDVQAGGIAHSGSTSVAYNTSSDYRLKENIAPMTGALAKIAQLNPVTYTWKEDQIASQGFIAHELQAVVPECVTGEKDAVDEEGNPKYQGIDTSFLVATLTAAIKEQQALITTLTERITALEGV